MNKFIFSLLLVVLASSFITTPNADQYMLVMLRNISYCDGKCNNSELTEYPKTSMADCEKERENLKKQYGETATYYIIAPNEGAAYYKYNKFVPGDCACKIIGVQKSSSVALAKEEINKKVAEERVKKPKAFHNFEIYSSWPR
jgi:hypothetical protein